MRRVDPTERLYTSRYHISGMVDHPLGSEDSHSGSDCRVPHC